MIKIVPRDKMRSDDKVTGAARMADDEMVVEEADSAEPNTAKQTGGPTPPVFRSTTSNMQ